MERGRLVDEYPVWHEVSGHSKNTILLYRWSLGCFHEWSSASTRSSAIEDIMIGDVRAFLVHEQQRDSRMKPKPPPIAYTQALRPYHADPRAVGPGFLQLAGCRGISRSEPDDETRATEAGAEAQRVPGFAEVERLFAVLNTKTFLGSRVYAIVALLYDNGLRAGEVCGIDIGDVDWPHYQLTVMGKGRKERLVPFSPPTHRALRKYLPLRERYAPEDGVALFINAEGQRLTRDALTHAIKRLGLRVGILVCIRISCVTVLLLPR